LIFPSVVSGVLPTWKDADPLQVKYLVNAQKFKRYLHFLANSHRVVGLYKLLPGVQDSGKTLIIYEVKHFFKDEFNLFL